MFLVFNFIEISKLRFDWSLDRCPSTKATLVVAVFEICRFAVECIESSKAGSGRM